MSVDIGWTMVEAKPAYHFHRALELSARAKLDDSYYHDHQLKGQAWRAAAEHVRTCSLSAKD